MTDRAAFEAWFDAEFNTTGAEISHGYLFARDADEPEEYEHHYVQCSWKAWQEAVRQEREACAKVCEEAPLEWFIADCADAIRARPAGGSDPA